MERPKPTDGIEDAVYEVLGAEMDDEDIEDLFYDCYDLLSRILERNNPQWLQNEGIKLKDRLEEVLSWYRIH